MYRHMFRHISSDIMHNTAGGLNIHIVAALLERCFGINNLSIYIYIYNVYMSVHPTMFDHGVRLDKWKQCYGASPSAAGPLDA
jgi:hypothetical protein